MAIISSLVEQMQIAASTGIHDGEAIVKQILAGAHATQVCSAIYKNGSDHIARMLEEVKAWMQEKDYSDLNAFRGKMNYGNIQNPQVYERSQFMKYFSSHH